MTVRDSIARVRSMAKEHTSDSDLSNRMIWNSLETALGLLIHREGIRFFKQDVFRNKEVIPTEVDLNCNNCLPWEQTGYWVELGNLWATKDGPIIRYVGSLDGFTEFRVVSQSEYVKKEQVKGNKQKYTYYRDGNLFIKTPVECIRVEYYEPFKQDECTILDQDVKVPNNMQDEWIKLGFQNLSVFLNKPIDNTDNNDSNR